MDAIIIEDIGIAERACNHIKYGKAGDYISFGTSGIKAVRIGYDLSTMPDVRFLDKTREWQDVEFEDACDMIENLIKQYGEDSVEMVRAKR